LTKEEFENVKVVFTADLDPYTKQPISLEYTRADFELTDMPLFQLAAYEKIKTLPLASPEANKLSVKH
jgi:hypothetical protein